MSEVVTGGGQERTGTDYSAPFPGPVQSSLFQAPRPSWREFLRWLIRDPKTVGAAIFGESDPEQGRVNLSRVLEGRNGRHFEVEWLDVVLDRLGPDADAAFVRFVCERRGYEMPAKKADPVRVQEELAEVRRTLSQTATALQQVTRAVEHIEKGLR